jgi:hypothetical protein
MRTRRFKMGAALVIALSAIASVGANTAKADHYRYGGGRYYERSSYYRYSDRGCYAPRPYYSRYYYSRSYCDPVPYYRHGGFSFSFNYGHGHHGHRYHHYRSHCGW